MNLPSLINAKIDGIGLFAIKKGPCTETLEKFGLLTIYIGWKSRSGKKRFHSIKIPAVIVKKRAATTGAVERNFFIG